MRPEPHASLAVTNAGLRSRSLISTGHAGAFQKNSAPSSGCDVASIPSKSHEVPWRVPAPSSRNRPPNPSGLVYQLLVSTAVFDHDDRVRKDVDMSKRVTLDRNHVRE